MAKRKTTAKKIKEYEFTSKAEFYSAFRYRNLIFYGGPIDNLAISCPWDVILKLDKYSSLPVPKLEVPDLFANLSKCLKLFENTTILEIPWPDGGVPDLPKVAWTALAKDLNEIAQARSNKEVEIAVCCKGGHGRTGTALAILKSLLLKEPVDPVASIRKTYLPESVETVRQIEYVGYVTGRKVSEQSSYSKKTYSSSSTDSKGYYSSNDKGYSSSSSSSSSTTTATTTNKTSSQIKDEVNQKISARNPNTPAQKALKDAPSLNYKQIAAQIERDGDLGSVAVKVSDRNNYPIHKATDCIRGSCPDKDSKLAVHCGKKNSSSGRVQEITGTVLA